MNSLLQFDIVSLVETKHGRHYKIVNVVNNIFLHVSILQVVGTLYTHHQKITLVDAGPSRQRTLTAFIGGLDLTEGRWDTPCHSLFSSLQKEHKDDFRQKSWPVSIHEPYQYHLFLLPCLQSIFKLFNYGIERAIGQHYECTSSTKH